MLPPSLLRGLQIVLDPELRDTCSSKGSKTEGCQILRYDKEKLKTLRVAKRDIFLFMNILDQEPFTPFLVKKVAVLLRYFASPQRIPI